MTTTQSVLEKIKESAKDLNSSDPVKRQRAQEIKRRYENGLFNAELEKEGAKPVPVKRPKIVMPEMPKTAPETQVSPIKEIGGDLMETAQNIGNTITQGAENVQKIATSDTLNGSQKIMGVLGSLFGTGAKTVSDVTIGVGKTVLDQDSEDKLKGIVQNAAQKVSETQIAKDVSDWYENLTPDNKLIVDSAGGFVALLSEVVGAGVAGKLSQPIKEGVKTVVDKGVDATKQTVKKTGEAIDTMTDAQRASRLITQETKVDEAVARIVQGTPEDIATAKKALMEVETDGVKTYSDLNSRLDDSIETLVKKQDAELAQYTDVYKKDQLARYKKVKGIDGKMTTVSDAPIIDALNQLDAYYSKIGDVSKSTIVKQYIDKLNSTGLTVDEMNKIARMHGVDLNAYNANGELASGLTKQAAENTRQGVKETLRQRLPDEVSKGIDESLSNLYATRKLTQDMETKVQKLYQKVKNRTLAQKVGGAVADVVDLASLGTLRGFVQKILPSNVGLKTANSLDLERELSKNLKQIEKLLEMKDGPEFDTALKKLMEDTVPQSKLPDESFNQGEIPTTNGASVIQSRSAIKRTADTSDVILRDLAKKNNVDYDLLNKEIDSRLAKAESWKQYVDTEAEKVVQGMIDVKVAIAPIKSKQRILEKTLKEEGGNIDNIKDVARNTIVPSTPEARAEVLKRMDARKDIARRKDQRPDDFMGYEGTIYNIKTPDGQIVETQVVSPEMTFGKNLPEFSKSVLGEDVFNEIAKRTGLEPGLGHVYYEKLRTMSNAEMLSPEGQDLIQKSFDYYSKLR